MGQNSARLDREKMGEMGEDATKKKNEHAKNNQFGSRSFRDDIYPCIWKFKFAWNMCSSICSHTTAS